MLGKTIPLALLGLVIVATACTVQNKGTNGKDDVRVETPLGDVKVQTDDAKVMASIGLPVYPGATLFKNEHDKGAADIDMAVGNYHMRVKAASYHTTDSPEKVLAFYRKELSRYGTVIQCNGKLAVGDPSKTSEGLTCENNDISVSDAPKKSDIELKAGSKVHQRIVGVEKQPDGTKIGLVLLDLPNDKKESN